MWAPAVIDADGALTAMGFFCVLAPEESGTVRNIFTKLTRVHYGVSHGVSDGLYPKHKRMHKFFACMLHTFT
eukprot:scaffold83808_cov114-Attheya_sp.AAC.2